VKRVEAGLIHDLVVQTDRVNDLQVQLEHTMAESLVMNQERKKGIDTQTLPLTKPNPNPNPTPVLNTKPHPASNPVTYKRGSMM
jgi:hypothetical protein